MNAAVLESESQSGTTEAEVTRVTSCPACGHSVSHPCERIELAGQHAFYSPDEAVQKRLTSLAGIPGDAYQMRQCAACGLEFADPQRAPTAGWYEAVYQTLELYPAARWEFGCVLKRLKADDSVGEIGCGSGEFLKQCRDWGVEAAGVDFAPSAVEACRASGLEAGILDLGGGAPPEAIGGPRSVIVAFQVLEHLDRASSLFALATCWAAPDATLWIAVPSDRRPSRYYRERDYLDQPPHHMTRWTEPALAAVASRHGWEMTEVIYEPIEASARIWWVSTRMPVYKFLQRKGLLKAPRVEKLVRALLAPLAFILTSLAGPRISGQSMLARCRRRERP